MPDELNRAVLARQCLLQRTDAPVPRVLEQMGGLQAQYAPSSYIGLWSRRTGMDRADLDRALEDRSVIQGTLMRVTIHLVSREDYWPFAIAVRAARREGWLRYLKDRFTQAEVEKLAGRTRELLADGPLKRGDILEALGIDNAAWISIGLWLDMVRVPPSGTWKQRRADLYGLAQTWVGPEPDIPEEEAVGHLTRRYLGAFGPASIADLVSWSGLPATTLAPCVKGLELVRRRDPAGKELFDLPGAPLPDASTPAPVRFLPTWDASLLVHCRRSGILPEEHRPRVFHIKTPHSVNTFTVNGRVAGTWRIEKGKVVTSAFEPLDGDAAAEVEQEARRLEVFVA